MKIRLTIVAILLAAMVWAATVSVTYYVRGAFVQLPGTNYRSINLDVFKVSTLPAATLNWWFKDKDKGLDGIISKWTKIDASQAAGIVDVSARCATWKAADGSMAYAYLHATSTPASYDMSVLDAPAPGGVVLYSASGVGVSGSKVPVFGELHVTQVIK